MKRVTREKLVRSREYPESARARLTSMNIHEYLIMWGKPRPSTCVLLLHVYAFAISPERSVSRSLSGGNVGMTVRQACAISSKGKLHVVCSYGVIDSRVVECRQIIQQGQHMACSVSLSTIASLSCHLNAWHHLA